VCRQSLDFAVLRVFPGVMLTLRLLLQKRQNT
jgi:hypothetical protein